MFVFRVSSALVVMVLLLKSAVFVSDDSKFLEVEALGAIEKRVSDLIDESVRDLREEKEREEEGASLSFAVAYVRIRKSIMRCMNGVCAWASGSAESVVRSMADLVMPDVRGTTAGSLRNHAPQTQRDAYFGLINP